MYACMHVYMYVYVCMYGCMYVQLAEQFKLLQQSKDTVARDLHMKGRGV